MGVSVLAPSHSWYIQKIEQSIQPWSTRLGTERHLSSGSRAGRYLPCLQKTGLPVVSYNSGSSSSGALSD